MKLTRLDWKRLETPFESQLTHVISDRCSCLFWSVFSVSERPWAQISLKHTHTHTHTHKGYPNTHTHVIQTFSCRCFQRKSISDVRLLCLSWTARWRCRWWQNLNSPFDNILLLIYYSSLWLLFWTAVSWWTLPHNEAFNNHHNPDVCLLYAWRKGTQSLST